MKVKRSTDVQTFFASYLGNYFVMQKEQTAVSKYWKGEMIIRLTFMRSKVFFQEIERMIMRLKVVFFRRSKVSIIFDNFDQEVERTITRSKEWSWGRKLKKYKNNIIIDFWSHEQFVSHKSNHEIKSFLCTGG